MKNKFWIFGIVGLIIVVAFFGCRKKSQEMPIPSTEPNVVTIIPEPIKETTFVTPAVIPTPIPKEEVKAVVPTKPTNEEIQLALKNVGLYKGEIDGKIGPKTKKAIEKFQAQNNLLVDGKVGPKTWAVLKAYLTASQPESGTQIRD